MMINDNKKHRLVFLVAMLLNLSISFSVFALEDNKPTVALPLPEPLTLADAINIGGLQSHPDILLSKANQMSALSVLEHAESRYELNASLDMSASLIDPSDLATDPSGEDHRATLNLRKQIYDFGYTSSAIKSAKDAVVASGFRQTHILRLQQIVIVKIIMMLC